MWATWRQRSRAIVSAIANEVGVKEIMLTISIALLSIGAGEAWPPAAWLAPSAVLLWIYLPTRYPFIGRSVNDRKE